MLETLKNVENAKAILALSEDLKPLTRPRGFQKLFAEMDTDGNGEIDFAEFSSVVNKTQEKSKIEQTFELIAGEGVDTISRSALLQALRDPEKAKALIEISGKFKPLLRPRGFASFFSKIDVNDDDRIDVKEFQEACNSVDAESKLKLCFDMVDVDKSGT